MKTIVSFGTEKIILSTKTVERTRREDIDVEVIGWGEKPSNWIFDRFDKGNEIHVEIQVEKERKLVLKKAHIIQFRSGITDTQLIFVTATVISEQYELKDGLVGCPDVWSVS